VRSDAAIAGCMGRPQLWLVALALALSACGGPGGNVQIFDRSYDNSRSSDADRGGYVVARGDTVYGIAQRFGVSTRALIDWNRLNPPYLLIPGQRLQLPSNQTYTVQSGDSVSAISRRFGVDMQTLIRLNNLRTPYTIHVGQQLQLPADARPVTEVAAATPSSSAPAVASPSDKPTAPTRAVVTSPAPPARATGGFVWPVEGRVVSSYGAKTSGLHNDGVNIAAPRGAPVRAADNGVVAYAGKEIRGFGNLLLIKHEDGLITAYAHADSLLVKRGDVVTRGQVVAKVGQTGSVESPQLHFEVRRGTEAVDPARYLPG
jgi:murein DD-endopeptidase MepM/ murein hydrolase activator NlpD